MGLARLIGREYHFVVGNYPSIFRVIWPEAVRDGSHTARAHACLSYIAPTYLLLPFGKRGSISIGQWDVFNHEKGAIWQSHLAAQKEGVVTAIIFSNHETS